MRKFLFPKIRTCAYLRAVPLPREGRFAIVTSVGSGMRWTRLFRQTSETCADGEVVWSWRPKAGVKFAVWRRRPCRARSAGDGGNKAWSPGRARRKLLKPSRRECRCFGWTCGDYACVLLPFAHKAAGAAKHPAFPAPSVVLRDKIDAKLGRIAPRECGCASPVGPQ